MMRVVMGILVLNMVFPVFAGQNFAGLFRQALEQNHEIRSSREGREAAVAMVGAAKSAYLPRLELSAVRVGFDKENAALIPPGTFAPVPLAFPLTEQYFTKGTASVDYLLFDFGGRKALVRSARKGQEAADLVVRSAIRKTGLDLVDAYAGVRRVSARIRALEQALAAARAHLKQVQAFRKEGLVSAADQYRLEAVVADLEGRLAESRGQLSSVGRMLKRLTGSEVDVDTLPPLPEPDGLLEETLLERALANREEPALLDVQAAVHRLNARRLKATLLPQLFARVAFSDTTDDLVFNQSNTTWLIGVKVKLFDGFETRYRRRSELLKAHASRSRMDDAKELVRVQVGAELDRFRSLRVQLEAARRRLTSAMENYRVAKLQFGEHLISSVDLSDAIMLMEEAQAGVAATETAWRAAGLRLRFLTEPMGEDWSWLKN